MADQSRVPVIITPFNTYVSVTDNFLQAIDPVSSLPNWQRLGLSSTQAADWHARRLKWDALWKKYKDKTKCTSIVRQDVRYFMKSFRRFAMPLLNIMAASPQAAAQEEVEFRFKTRRAKPSRHDSKIAEICNAGIDVSMHGWFTFRCRADNQSGRGRKPQGADSVQVAYRIFDTLENLTEEDVLNIDSPLFLKEIFSKSKFVFEAGSNNSGKWIVIYTRWFNTKKRHVAGSWSSMHRLVVA